MCPQGLRDPPPPQSTGMAVQTPGGGPGPSVPLVGMNPETPQSCWENRTSAPTGSLQGSLPHCWEARPLRAARSLCPPKPCGDLPALPLLSPPGPGVRTPLSPLSGPRTQHLCSRCRLAEPRGRKGGTPAAPTKRSFIYFFGSETGLEWGGGGAQRDHTHHRVQGVSARPVLGYSQGLFMGFRFFWGPSKDLFTPLLPLCVKGRHLGPLKRRGWIPSAEKHAKCPLAQIGGF